MFFFLFFPLSGTSACRIKWSKHNITFIVLFMCSKLYHTISFCNIFFCLAEGHCRRKVRSRLRQNQPGRLRLWKGKGNSVLLNIQSKSRKMISVYLVSYAKNYLVYRIFKCRLGFKVCSIVKDKIKLKNCFSTNHTNFDQQKSYLLCD